MKILDLFSGQGGAGEGYRRAGFEIVGVDLADHGKRYPGEFHKADALEFLAEHWREFDAVHASPPCQSYSIATAGNLAARAKYPRLIAATRELLQQTGLPYVIENVEQARSEMVDPVLLCGRMFGLGAKDEDGEWLTLDRHRLFEVNFPVWTPRHGRHDGAQVGGVYGGSRRARVDSKAMSPAYLAVLDKYAARVERGGGYVPRSVRVQQELLGIDWMTVRGMQESIPPAYAEHIGRYLLDNLRGTEVAA